MTQKMTRRLIDSIVDSVNIWLNGLVAEEQLLGGRVEFREDENSTTALMAGKAVFRVFLTPPSPAKELNFVSGVRRGVRRRGADGVKEGADNES